MADETRVSQAIVEDLVGDGGDAAPTNVSQTIVEALNSGTSESRVSQFIIEALNAATGEVKVSQLVVELLNAPTSEAKVSQLCIELVRPAFEPVVHIPPRVYGTIIG